MKVDINVVKNEIWSRVTRFVGNKTTNSGITFHQGDCSVSYYGIPAIGQLVANYLFYNKNCTSSCNWKIYSVVDNLFFESILNLVEVHWSPCLDYGDIGLILDCQNGKLILSKSTCGIIAVDVSERRINIVSYDAQGAFNDSYKTIRQLLTGSILRRGWLPLHASCVTVEGKAIVFVGPKGSGKSSCLLYSLVSKIPNLSFISNDRVFLEFDAEHAPKISCWPTILNFGVGALKQIPLIDEYIDDSINLNSSGISFLLLDLPLSSSMKGLPGTKKIFFSPSEIDYIFGIEPCSDSELVAIIDVTIEPEITKSFISEIVSDERKLSIFDSCRESDLQNHFEWLNIWGESSRDAIESGRRKVLNKSISNVPFFQLTAGFDMAQVVNNIVSSFTFQKPSVRLHSFENRIHLFLKFDESVLLVSADGDSQWEFPHSSSFIREGDYEVLQRLLRDLVEGDYFISPDCEFYDFVESISSEKVETQSDVNATVRRTGKWYQVMLSNDSKLISPPPNDRLVYKWVLISDLDKEVNVGSICRRALSRIS